MKKGIDVPLFPSKLVLPEELGVAKGARQRARRRGRGVSWFWTDILWNFFTFLEGVAHSVDLTNYIWFDVLRLHPGVIIISTFPAVCMN